MEYPLSSFLSQIARPFLRPREYGMFEADQPAALMHFEKIHMWMLIVEKNIVSPRSPSHLISLLFQLYPLTVISCLSASSRSLFIFSHILIPIIGFRLLRSAMAVPHQIYVSSLLHLSNIPSDSDPSWSLFYNLFRRCSYLRSSSST